MTPAQRALARRHLDARLEALRGQPLAMPRRGWIRATREALGMSSSDLAKRMGVSSQQISQYEAAEVAGTMKLQTLERVAAALGASVHYAIVPVVPLEAMVADRARAIAISEVRAVDHSMALENQLPTRDANDLIERRARELIDAPRLWSERG